jgi:hypothetical protein
VSLGRNVTVSWTKFRTAMRIASVIVLPQDVGAALGGPGRASLDQLTP